MVVLRRRSGLLSGLLEQCKSKRSVLGVGETSVARRAKQAAYFGSARKLYSGSGASGRWNHHVNDTIGGG